MTALGTRPADPVRRLPWSRVAVLALVPALPVAAYAAGVLLPYYVNDLDELPLDELGAHDPKDLWPGDSWWGTWLRLIGILVGGLAPAALVLTGMAAVVYAVRGSLTGGRRERSPAMAVCLVGLAAVCLWSATLFSGPTTAALSRWVLD